jgi:dihydropteroate synthase
MRLELGPRRFDISTRAVVIGTLCAGASPDRLAADAERMVSEGADALDVMVDAPMSTGIEERDLVVVAVAHLRARVDVPLAVTTASSGVVDAALAAGAVIATNPGDLADPAYLAAVAVASASIVVPRGALAEQAEAAGIRHPRIVVDVDLAGLVASSDSAATGYAMCHSASGVGEADLGAYALAVTHGVRLLRTADVRGARRVAAVIAAILEAA